MPILQVGTVDTFVPDTPITATRVQAQALLAPANCSTNGVIQITDGMPEGTRNLTIAAAANDSGSFAVNYAAGATVAIKVITAPTCMGGGGRYPASVNIGVQYKPQ